MKRFCRLKFIVPAFLIYCIFSLYTISTILFAKVKDDHENLKRDIIRDKGSGVKNYTKQLLNNSSKNPFVVEIWSKAAIGHYFWEHIFNEKLHMKSNGFISAGKMIDGEIEFRFRTGPGVVISKSMENVEYLILILNGREDAKIKFAQMWLDSIKLSLHLKKLAVVLLGSENCQNYWITPHLRKNGGFIDLLFLVYDDSTIDNETIFQWPLGVATYRSFPKFNISYQELDMPRPYVFNFMGTVYQNSSREQLLQILEKDADIFKATSFIKIRNEWVPKETNDSLNEYITALRNSDLTLNPSGKNNECYRIYEALSLGSVPIIEDSKTVPSCDRNSFRILKTFKNSPLIFIKDWSELKNILKHELKLPQWKKIARRNIIVKWYQHFLSSMKTQFIKAIQKNFFNLN